MYMVDKKKQYLCLSVLCQNVKPINTYLNQLLDYRKYVPLLYLKTYIHVGIHIGTIHMEIYFPSFSFFFLRLSVSDFQESQNNITSFFLLSFLCTSQFLFVFTNSTLQLFWPSHNLLLYVPTLPWPYWLTIFHKLHYDFSCTVPTLFVRAFQIRLWACLNF